MDFDLVLGWLTGLRWVSPEISGDTLVRTALVAHTCNAVVCGVIAANNGHRRVLWMVLGLAFGVWAVAVLLLLPKRT